MGLFESMEMATAYGKQGKTNLSTDQQSLMKTAGVDGTGKSTEAGGMNSAVSAGINMGVGALSGILQAKAAEKAQKRQLELDKQNQKVSIASKQAQTQASLLDTLAANLANTLTGG